MRMKALRFLPMLSLCFCTSVMAARPHPGKFPNLVKSWEALQAAKRHVQKAEAAHARTGTLGGHGREAVQALNAAEVEIDAAVAYADTHRVPGEPGAVTPKPPLVARPD